MVVSSPKKNGVTSSFDQKNTSCASAAAAASDGLAPSLISHDKIMSSRRPQVPPAIDTGASPLAGEGRTSGTSRRATVSCTSVAAASTSSFSFLRRGSSSNNNNNSNRMQRSQSVGDDYRLPGSVKAVDLGPASPLPAPWAAAAAAENYSLDTDEKAPAGDELEEHQRMAKSPKKRWKGRAIRKNKKSNGTIIRDGNVQADGQRRIASPDTSIVGEPPVLDISSATATNAEGTEKTGRHRENRDDCLPSTTSSESSMPIPSAASPDANTTAGTAKRRGFRSMVRVRQTTKKTITVSTSPSSSSSKGAASPTINVSSPNTTTTTTTTIGQSSGAKGGTGTQTVASTDVSTTDRTVKANAPLVSILHHSFVEACMPSRLDQMQIDDDDDYILQDDGQKCNNYDICSSPTDLTHDDEARLNHRLDDIEDPTVQESIECVFAHQLENGLDGFFDDDEDDDTDVPAATKKKKAWSKLSSKLTSPSSSRQARSRSSVKDDASIRSDVSRRNASAVAAVLGIPHPLAHTASDAELVAAARRSVSDSNGLGLQQPTRPNSTTAAGATKPMPFSERKRCATTGSIRRLEGSVNVDEDEDELAAHELTRRTWSRKNFDSRSLVFIGTIGGAEGSTNDAAVEPSIVEETTMSSQPAPPPGAACPSCHSGARHAPHAPPHLWPQAPLLLRPTPGSGTKIRGIRYSGSDQYLWQPTLTDHTHHAGDEALPSSCWSDALQSTWHGGGGDVKMTPSAAERPTACHECAPIPVNNGNEAPGEALVVDFESDLFIGSVLIRIRNSSGTTPAPYDDSKGYFTGMNRRYQAVVRGMFKKEGIAMTDCVTGQVLNRKCGKLPPKMLLRGAIKVISFFAPQLQTMLDGDRPTCISPLGSTPQVMRLKRENGFDDAYQADQTIELSQEEPDDCTSSLLSMIPGCEESKAPTSIARAKARKKAFDKLYAVNDKSLVFDTSTEYSFEFLQHLIDFDSFGVDLGSMIGTVFLKEMLDGQPLKFMAAKRKDANNGKKKKCVGEIGLDYIWSFDIFHECVYDDAKKNDVKMKI